MGEVDSHGSRCLEKQQQIEKECRSLAVPCLCVHEPDSGWHAACIKHRNPNPQRLILKSQTDHRTGVLHPRVESVLEIIKIYCFIQCSCHFRFWRAFFCLFCSSSYFTSQLLEVTGRNGKWALCVFIKFWGLVTWKKKIYVKCRFSHMGWALLQMRPAASRGQKQLKSNTFTGCFVALLSLSKPVFFNHDCLRVTWDRSKEAKDITYLGYGTN